MNHYTYEITKDSGVRMSYIGVRQCKCPPEEDTDYWGSSKHLPDNIQDNHTKTILRTFDSREDAVKHEVYLHNRFDVAANPLFYNRAKQTGTKFDRSGLPGPWLGKKRPDLSAKQTGRKNTWQVGKKNCNYGKPLPTHVRQACIAARAKVYDLYLYNSTDKTNHLYWGRIANLNKWCKVNGYDHSALWHTANRPSKNKQHKGVFAREVEDG